MSTVESGPVRVPHPPRRSSARPFLPVVDETSAGGLIVDVVDGEAVTVVIARRNRGGRLEWCLPKGHIEHGETPSETAEREVFEETGIEGRAIVHLATIDYWFAAADRRVHKLVHHYLLEALGGELTVLNDPDREAEEAAWVPLNTVATRLAYPNERRVVAAARDVLAGRA
ncbi:NUDIX domain-containing protein [Ruaniaceae bacterium KH17]|nr:NUDIX domain-containing protein [Ruaniaceae bacterium KH17]